MCIETLLVSTRIIITVLNKDDVFYSKLLNRFFLVKSNNADNVEIAKVLLRFKIIKKLNKILTEIFKVVKTMAERTKWDHIMPTSIN